MHKERVETPGGEVLFANKMVAKYLHFRDHTKLVCL